MQNFGPATLVVDRWMGLDGNVSDAGQIIVSGLDLTGYGLEAQARLYPNAAGAALLTLNAVTQAGAEGLRLVGVDASTGYPVSIVTVTVAAASAQGLPSSSTPGEDAVLAWDIAIQPPNGAWRRLTGGALIVRAGVTHQ